ncbi:MAG: outer membrane beta-barrel protein [Elusimicrobia bacterium]|nr:outer membrane beta-barrel protein [Elusimicrobiota bacterium]
MIRKPLAFAAAALVAVPAFAGNLMLGPAKLSPSYRFETRYEDNIYRVPHDENHTAVAGGGVRGSWIFANDLGLGADLPFAQNNKLDLGYKAGFENYTTQSKGNDAINQFVDGAWTYAGSKTKAKLSDSYANTQDPAFNPNGTVLNGALVSRERHWQNDARASAEYYLGDKFFAGVDGGDQVLRYLDRSGGTTSLADSLDTSIVDAGVKLGYRIQPKTRVFGSFHRRNTHYTEGTRYDNHRDELADFGVEGDLTGKLTGLIQTGFIYQNFDLDPTNPTLSRDARHWSFLARLDYAPTSRDKVVLVANRSTQDSASTASRYYVTGGASLTLDHQFTSKITAGVVGGVQIDRYSEDISINSSPYKTRRDDNYRAGAHVDYQIADWASTGLSFTNNDRFSTFSREYSYRDDITGWNLKLTF